MADGSLIFDTKIDQSGFQKGINQLNNIGNKAFKALGTAAIGAGVAIAGMGAAAIKVGSDFEAGMSQVAATMGISAQAIREGDETFQALEKAAREAGATTMFSATQASEALNYLALAGYDADKAIDALPKVLNLASAGGLELGYAADIATNSMNALGLGTDELEGFIDQLAKTSQKSGTDVSQLGEAILTVGGTAKIMAGGTVELNTQLGILADAGVKGAEGGTALRNVLLALSAPTKKQADMLKSLGVETYDANGNFRATNEIFEDLNAVLGTMTEQQRTEVLSNLFNKVDLKAANALLANSGERFNELSNEIANADGAAAQMAETLNDNLKGRMEILKSALSELGIQIYQGIELPLKQAAEGAIASVEQLSQAFDEGGFAGLVGEVGNVLANIVVEITSYAPKLFDAAVDMITSFIEGIRANLPQIVDSALDLMDSFITAIIEILPEIVALGFELVINLINGIADRLPDLMTQAIDMVILIADTIIDNIDLIVEAGIRIILALVQGIIDNLPKLIEQVPRIINEFAHAIYNNLPTILKAGVEIILMLIKGIIQAIPTLITNIPQIIMAIVNVITLYNWTQLGKNVIKWLGEGITSMVGNISGIAKNLAQAVTDTIKNIFKGGVKIGQGFISNLITGIKGMISNLLSVASSLAKDAIETIYLAFLDAPNLGKSLVQGIWNGIDNVTGWILDQIKGFGNAVMNGIKGIFGIKSPSTRMRDEVGVQLVKGIGQGIQDETPALRNLTEHEMDKLISDYGRYGEEAVKEYGKLSQKEMDKIIKDARKNGQDVAEALAKGMEDKTREITNALEKIRGETIKELDRLGEATITALKKKYQEEERLQLDSLRRQTENIRNETDKRIQEYDRELQAKLRLIDDNTSEEVRQLQEAIDAINNRTKEEEKQLKEQEYQAKLNAKERELLEAKSAEERAKIQKELNEMKAAKERELLLEQRQMQIEGLRSEMDRIRKQSDEKKLELEKEYQEKKKNEENKLNAVIANLENEMEETKKHYAALLDADNLQAEARLLMLDENNQELIELLETYNPKWFDAGQSFGESLLDGLNSMKYSIQQAVDEILGMVSTVDMANARIIQAKQDWHEAEARGDKAAMDEAHRRAEEARKQGGTIKATDPLAGLAQQMKAAVDAETNRAASSITSGTGTTYSSITNNDNGITQNVTIVNPEGTPSENARQLKKAGRELALGY